MQTNAPLKCAWLFCRVPIPACPALREERVTGAGRARNAPTFRRPCPARTNDESRIRRHSSRERGGRGTPISGILGGGPRSLLPRRSREFRCSGEHRTCPSGTSAGTDTCPPQWFCAWLFTFARFSSVNPTRNHYRAEFVFSTTRTELLASLSQITNFF